MRIISAKDVEALGLQRQQHCVPGRGANAAVSCCLASKAHSAEVGKMVNEQYPVLNHQPALMRAFKATLERGAVRGARRLAENKSRPGRKRG